jgi:hypothetical protein
MQNIIGSTIWSRKMLRMTMEIYIDQSWHATHAINAGTACDLSTAGCPVDQVLDLTAPTGATINQPINQPISQSVNQSLNQPICQSVTEYPNHKTLSVVQLGSCNPTHVIPTEK